MIIRKMVIDDYEEIYNLWISCSGMGLNNLDDSKNGIEKFLNRNPDTCFAALIDGKIVGTILVGNDGRRGYIYHTAVNPKYQRQGIGAGLVKASLNALKEQGINRVALVVFERNKSGNAFWESMGFSVRDDLVYRNKTINEFIRSDT